MGHGEIPRIALNRVPVRISGLREGPFGHAFGIRHFAVRHDHRLGKQGAGLTRFSLQREVAFAAPVGVHNRPGSGQIGMPAAALIGIYTEGIAARDRAKSALSRFIDIGKTKRTGRLKIRFGPEEIFPVVFPEQDILRCSAQRCAAGGEIQILTVCLNGVPVSLHRMETPPVRATQRLDGIPADLIIRDRGQPVGIGHADILRSVFVRLLGGQHQVPRFSVFFDAIRLGGTVIADKIRSSVQRQRGLGGNLILRIELEVLRIPVKDRQPFAGISLLHIRGQLARLQRVGVSVRHCLNEAGLVRQRDSAIGDVHVTVLRGDIVHITGDGHEFPERIIVDLIPDLSIHQLRILVHQQVGAVLRNGKNNTLVIVGNDIGIPTQTIFVLFRFHREGAGNLHNFIIRGRAHDVGYFKGAALRQRYIVGNCELFIPGKKAGHRSRKGLRIRLAVFLRGIVRRDSERYFIIHGGDVSVGVFTDCQFLRRRLLRDNRQLRILVDRSEFNIDLRTGRSLTRHVLHHLGRSIVQVVMNHVTAFADWIRRNLSAFFICGNRNRAFSVGRKFYSVAPGIDQAGINRPAEGSVLDRKMLKYISI